MKTLTPTRRPKPSEEGYMLLAVIFLVALLTLSLSVALPKISKQIQRDRELETMNRGKQYIRGIRMYYKTFNAYPSNVDALVKPTNNVRFLRKKYTDPTTGKEDWKPVRFGQNKAPTAMGFFGQSLTGSTVAGTGSGATSTGFNSSTSTTATDSSATPSDSSNSNAANNTASGTSTGLSGQTGQTFGGAGIIGFSPNSPKQSIMVYKTKTHYNEWEFVYDPVSEQSTTQTGGNTNSLGTGTGSGSGSGSGSSIGTGTGSGSGGGSGGGTGSGSNTSTP
jgi:type II secretory pathway pseudopilin PulG